jgi:hypothetical protein
MYPSLASAYQLYPIRIADASQLRRGDFGAWTPW